MQMADEMDAKINRKKSVGTVDSKSVVKTTKKVNTIGKESMENISQRYIDKQKLKGNRMKITIERVIEAIKEDDNLGFCLACGADACCVEPDAEGYECEECDEHRVMGAENCLFELG
jgi:hypothetical protein